MPISKDPKRVLCDIALSKLQLFNPNTWALLKTAEIKYLYKQDHELAQTLSGSIDHARTI